MKESERIIQIILGRYGLKNHWFYTQLKNLQEETLKENSEVLK